MKQKLKIWDCQLYKYMFDEELFESEEKIKNQLVNFHSVDCNEKSLRKMSLAELLEFGEWELHDSKGELVLIN